jgi:GxxExxY protein
MTDLVYKDESYRINGACFEVYKDKGCGFLEDVYQECLEIEFGLQGIDFIAQRPLKLDYKGTRLRKKYIPDFICSEKIIVEIKAVTAIDDVHRAQVHNYLRATGYKLGLIVNFGHYPKVQIERIIH